MYITYYFVETILLEMKLWRWIVVILIIITIIFMVWYIDKTYFASDPSPPRNSFLNTSDDIYEQPYQTSQNNTYEILYTRPHNDMPIYVGGYNSWINNERSENTPSSLSRLLINTIITTIGNELGGNLNNYDLTEEITPERPPTQYRSDSENSHDSYVVDSVKKIVFRLRDKYSPLVDKLPEYTTWVERNHRSKLARYRSVVGNLNFETNVVPFNITPHQAFNLVYQYGVAEDPETLERLIEIITDDELYNSGFGRCPTGMLEQVISAVDNGEGNNTIAAQQYVKELAMVKLGQIQVECDGDAEKAKVLADQRLADNEYYIRNRENLLASFE